MSRIAVIGASGFVGSAVTEAARESGHDVLCLHAPRLQPTGSGSERAITALASRLVGVDVVINCAGVADAAANHSDSVTAANAILPGVIGEAAKHAGVRRFVHVSSAVVQGRLTVLDGSGAVDAFSVYAKSKLAGEWAAREHGPEFTTIYRPPSVHGPNRRHTHHLAAVARSPFASVAAPGAQPTPQTHVSDVASAVVFLATSPSPPPPVVHHPWQGLTTSDLLRLLGGREPTRIPEPVARALLRAGRAAAKVVTGLDPHVRRVEMAWFGQRQAESWLTVRGWTPVTTASDWAQLGRDLRH